MECEEFTWESLRTRSLMPGGFGEDRSRVWPALLGVQPLSEPPPYFEIGSTKDSSDIVDGEDYSSGYTDPHPDERQIKLDTDRSFVLYPPAVYPERSPASRDVLQQNLHALMVALFRKRRSLHYFQGFHDIISVLFLTLPRPLHLPCAEKIAIHRVRDAMGIGLEPMLGMLRILRNLLKLIDPEYAKLLENTSPLPYHALSNILTLFSHDVPALPQIQHVWDFLLVREPLAVIWLAAAVILYRKESICLLAQQDEEGMMHSLLSSFPELVDQEPDSSLENCTEGAKGEKSEKPLIGKPTSDKACNVHLGGEEPFALTSDPPSESSWTLPSRHDTCNHTAVASYDTCSDHACYTRLDPIRDREPSIPVTPLSSNENTVINPHSPLFPDLMAEDKTTMGNREATVSHPMVVDETDIMVTSHSQSQSTSFKSLSPHHGLVDPCMDELPSTNVPLGRVTMTESPYPGPSCSNSTSRLEPGPSNDGLLKDSTAPVTRSPETTETTQASMTTLHHKKASRRPQPLYLPSLLRQADALLINYPPSHTALRVYEIMGRDSVVQTWHAPMITKVQGTPEDKWQCDDYLESLANSHNIVVPSPPPSPLLQPRSIAKKHAFPLSWKDTNFLYLRSIRLRLGVLRRKERRLLIAGAMLVVLAAIALSHDKMVRTQRLRALWENRWFSIPSVLTCLRQRVS